MSWSSVLPLAVALAITVILALLPKLLPPPPVRADAGPSYTELKARFERTDMLMLGLFFLTTGVFTVAIWWLLSQVAVLHAMTLPDAEYKLTVTPVYWMLPALFLAIVASSLPTTVLLRRHLGSAYGDFERYWAMRTPYDGDKALRVLTMAVGIVCGVAILLGLDFYVLIDRDTVVINRFLSLGEERYGPGDLIEIRTAPAFIASDGATVRRRLWVMVFADGSHYSSNDLPRDPSRAELEVMFTQLAHRTGRPLRELRALQRADQ